MTVTGLRLCGVNIIYLRLFAPSASRGYWQGLYCSVPILFYFDTVLFFQKGKFFELYEEDARIGHREFDLKLTERVKMCMVSVPFTPSSPINLTRSGCLSRASSCGLPSSSVQGIKSERVNKLRLPSGASWLALTR